MRSDIVTAVSLWNVWSKNHSSSEKIKYVTKIGQQNNKRVCYDKK